jgi:hypothetical protein
LSGDVGEGRAFHWVRPLGTNARSPATFAWLPTTEAQSPATFARLPATIAGLSAINVQSLTTFAWLSATHAQSPATFAGLATNQRSIADHQARVVLYLREVPSDQAKVAQKGS